MEKGIDTIRIARPKEQEEKVIEKLHYVELGERLHDGTRKLFGEQKQRVALAWALVHDPELLRLDR